MNYRILSAVALALPACFVHAHNQSLHNPIMADAHAPIGVMGEHHHKQGEWMFSYRYMTMNMEGNIDGSDSISPDETVSTLSNPYGPPDNVRVVPTEMTTNMHMLGGMYAPSNNLTIMVMVNYLEKEMDNITYQRMTGTTRLGGFTAKTRGLGDTNVSGIWRINNTETQNLYLNLGLSLPTGSIKEEDQVFNPMGMTPTMRLPMAMQLGSGTYDLEPGFTVTGRARAVGWGGQYKATLRLGENNQGYTLGDKQTLTGWASYRFAPAVSSSVRIVYSDEETVDGFDEDNQAPIQTSNPENYGGERLDMAVGVNLVGQSGMVRGHRVAIEYQTTLQQKANGVQLEMQDMLTVGYQYAF